MCSKIDIEKVLGKKKNLITINCLFLLKFIIILIKKSLYLKILFSKNMKFKLNSFFFQIKIKNRINYLKVFRLLHHTIQLKIMELNKLISMVQCLEAI